MADPSLLKICTACHCDHLYLAASRADGKVVSMNPHLTTLFAVMSPEGMLGLRIMGVIGLIIILPLGVVLYRNQDRLFGRNSDAPNETRGSLVYGLTQTWLVYVGLVHLALWLTFGL